MAAGSIVVSLLLSTASFETDTQRASKNLKQFQKDAEAAGKAVGLAFVGAVAGLAAMVTSSINAADHLNDLSKKTGIAADTLGGIGFAAGQAGGDIESATAAAGKLNKSLAEAAAGNPQAAEAFKALGISVLDAAGNTKKADVALAEIADKFAGYADGPEKAALALRIFGKAGADIIPLLDDGGKALLENIEYFKRYSGVTVDTAEKADQFNDTLGKLKLLSGAFGQTLASDLLPTLQNLADLWLENKEKGDQFAGVAGHIADVFKGVVVGAATAAIAISTIGDQIGAFLAQLNALAHLDFKGFAEIGHESSANFDKAGKQITDFYDAIYNGRKKADSATAPDVGGKKPPAPRLSGGPAAADTAAQVLKKQLDGQLKLIQDAEKAQADAYKVGQSFLDGVFEDGLTSQQDYFAAQKNLRDANLQNVTDAFDKEIAAQRAFIANPVAKPADRVAAEEKIKLAVQQRSEAVTAASAADILATQSNARAVLQLRDAYNSLQSSVLAARGDDIGAQRLRDAEELRKATELVKQAGGSQQTITDLKAEQDLRIERLQSQKDYAKLLDDTGRKEQEIYLDAQSGAKGELATLAAVRDARQAAIVQLQAQADAAARIAASPYATPDDIKRANDLALAVKKAAVELDPLADKFRNIFTDAGTNAFADLLNGKTGLKGALTQFFTQIGTEINNSLAKELSTAVFGKDGVLGGLGGVFSKAFGGGKGGDLTGFKTLGVDPATSALQMLAQAAGGASTALGGSGAAGATGSAFTPATGSSWLGAFGSLFSGGGSGALQGAFSQTGVGSSGFGSGLAYGNQDLGAFLAEGTNMVPRDNFKATLHKGEAVVPARFNPALHTQPQAKESGGKTFHITTNIMLQGAVDKSTAGQLAAKNARAVQSSLARGTV